LALERTKTDSESIGATADASATALKTGWATSHTTVDRGTIKIDYNLSEDHHFEYTKLYDRTRVNSRAYGYDYATHSSNGVPGNAGETTTNCCGASVGAGLEYRHLQIHWLPDRQPDRDGLVWQVAHPPRAHTGRL
jgi:hypothetical protein